MNTIILPYKTGSASARSLAESLNARRMIIDNGRTFNPRSPTLLINWGNSGRNFNRTIVPDNITMLNGMDAVGDASNKLTAFQLMDRAGVSTVPFTSDVRVAEGWLRDSRKVVVRNRLAGHSGEGIEIFSPAETLNLPAAPLYTEYTPRSEEYRIHVVKGVIIDAQRKARRLDVPDEDVNWSVRNFDNGFTYARDFQTIPRDVSQQAVAAVRALGLDFGAVDIIWNATRERAYVLEVNTACGLEGTTLSRYSQAFREIANNGMVLTSLQLHQRENLQRTLATLAPNIEIPAAPPAPSPTEENIEPSGETVVQPNTVVYGIFWNNILDREVGLFSSQEAALASLQDSQFYNMHQVDSSVAFGVQQLEVVNA